MRRSLFHVDWVEWMEVKSELGFSSRRTNSDFGGSGEESDAAAETKVYQGSQARLGTEFPGQHDALTIVVSAPVVLLGIQDRGAVPDSRL